MGIFLTGPKGRTGERGDNQDHTEVGSVDSILYITLSNLILVAQLVNFTVTRPQTMLPLEDDK